MCLSGEEVIICRCCCEKHSLFADILYVSSITMKSSESSKRLSFYVTVSEIFNIATNFRLRGRPVTPMTFVGVRYLSDIVLYVLLIFEKKKKYPYNLVCDTICNAIHYVCALNLNIPGGNQKPTKGLFTNTKNAQIQFLKDLKTQK